MDDRHAVNREVLQGEAQLLGDLIEQHRQDLLDVRGGSRFVYFIDAHELKAYLHANSRDMLEGFIFHVERALEAQGTVKDTEARVRLKAEQVQRRLLFEQPRQLLLLPSHAEEMDEEVAYISHLTLPQDYDLVGIARQQWGRMMGKGISRKDLTRIAELATEGNRTSKKRLLGFLTAEVPALIQLLFPTPDSLKSRLTTLLSHSRVRLLSGADWGQMGFSPEQGTLLDACVASVDDLTLWTRQLIAGRRNSLQANRRDASAMAYISALNRCFERMHVNAKACLITRATTLLRVMRTLRASGNVEAQECLRHSRLVLTQADEGKNSPVGDRTLDVVLDALQTYDQRLAIPPSTDVVAPEAEANELLSAWNAFEDARLTLEFAQESTGRSVTKVDDLEEEQWRALVTWLQSDDDVSNIVEQHLKWQVAQFKAAMVARDAEGLNDAPVWVFETRRAESRGVLAIEVNGLGPLEIPRRFFDSSGSLRFLTDSVGDDVSEELVVLAFLQGCQKQWTLARFYARQALQSAQIMGRNRVRIEARLLQAQLLRAGAPTRNHEAEGSDTTDRFSQASDLLLSRSGRRLDDSRVEAEWWALQLERLVDVRAAGSGTGPELLHGVQAIHQALAGEDHDAEVRVRFQELLLAYGLAGLRKWRTTGDIDDAAFRRLREAVGSCHRGLTQSMNDWRLDHDLDELPHFSRAMEILGYELVRRLAIAAGEAAGDEPNVPAALLFDVVTLQAHIARNVDEVSRLVAMELVRLIDRTRGRRQFQVVYAPIADRAEILALIQKLPDATSREAAARANDIVHELGNSQRFLEGHEAERAQIAEGIRLFDRALSMPDMDETVRYHLDVELGYLHLLSALAETGADKQRALTQVAHAYEILVRRYPDSSVLRYRQSTVLEELHSDDAAFEAINDAMRLMTTDTRINPDHWFRSVVRRRLSVRFSAKATEMRDRLKGVDDAAARDYYLEHMAKAYQLVSEGGSPSRMGATYIERLEARRRLNNQVYCAALYGCSGGDIGALPNLSRERLLDLTRQLLPEGDIRDVPEVNIAHTIGLAYSTLGETRLAAEAGERVMQLIARSGDNAESDAMRQMLNDALSWIGAVDPESTPTPFR
jgi:hypothetical protein